MLTLDLAMICYGAASIERVAAMNLPKIDGVRYVVSWQAHGDMKVPMILCRDDVSVWRTDTRGAGINRNNAISHCSADLILFADDDLQYTREQLLAVIETFESHPEVDLVTFKATMPSPPIYPKAECRLGDPLPRGYYVSAFNIAYRRKSVGDLLCHPDFGAGAPRFAGADDSLFLLAAIRRGLNCHFFPIDICTHPQESTGTKARLTSANLRAQGCYIRLCYPKTWLPRIVLKAYRCARVGQATMLKGVRYMLSGAAAAPRILREGRRYLW